MPSFSGCRRHRSWRVRYESSALVDIHGWSDVRRGLPLFETLLVFENQPIDESFHTRAAAAGLAVARVARYERTHYALMCEVIPGETLRLRLSYDRGRLDPHAIARLADHLQTVLAGMAADPAALVGTLSLLTEGEQAQLARWNETREAYDEDESLTALLDAQVQRSPHAIAIVDRDGSLTYEELRRRVRCVAGALVRRGVRRGQLVGLAGERGTDFLVGMLAAFEAGAAYVPIDRDLPALRHEQVLAQSDLPVIVIVGPWQPTDAHGLSAAAAARGVEMVALETCVREGAGAGVGIEPNGVRCGGNDLAYVIYTSGSTGVPKGAMVEHRGMLNHLRSKIELLGLTSHDRVAQTASIAFDVSVWQFLAVLLVGGTVDVIPDGIAHDPERLPHACEARGITIWEVVPSFLAMALARLDEHLPRPPLSRLRYVLSTGERLRVDVASAWFQAYADIALINAYGPTECSDDVTHAVLRVTPVDDGDVAIGTPIVNTTIHVLDADGGRVPPGVSGELFVGGIAVGRGYFRDARRTAEAFVPDPFDDTPGARLYRTSDRARHRLDGQIEYLGRRDGQVKQHGQRLELGEIETQLARHDAVDDAVVLLREDEAKDAQLVAYVVPSPGRPAPSLGELRQFVMDAVPAYMAPARLVVLDAWPRTATGKIDRRALPAPAIVPDMAAAPQSALEEVLCGIWADVLDVQQVGVHDDFFERGGHSLLATQVIARVRELFEIEVPLRALFQAPTVSALAATMIAHEPTPGRLMTIADVLMRLEQDSAFDAAPDDPAPDDAASSSKPAYS